MRYRILGVIPARGGSKGVPRKNIYPILGKPMIWYTINAALDSGAFERVICSTDDEEIAEVAKDCGAEVPFIRPKNLADDQAPMVPVMQHAVRFAEEQDGKEYDYVYCLQPTCPLRSVEDIKAGVRKIVETGADSVISVVKVEKDHPILMKRIESDQLFPYILEEKEGTRRQDYKPDAYRRTGSVYITKRDVLIKDGSIWGKVSRPLIVPVERSHGIDDLIDLQVVKALLERI